MHRLLVHQVVEAAAEEVAVAKTKSEALKEIANVIIYCENRCMAADGPVTPTNEEITNDELIQIWKLATATYKR